MVLIDTQPIRGMHDYVPPESEILTWIVDEFKDVVRRFGYREIKTPTIERFELFALKSGEEIRESMYVFKDKAGREVALRPEVTPSVIRVYIKELQARPKPIRLFYIANVFRYDEPQYGRYREFTQAGVEILGGDTLYYDLELIQVLEEFYDRIGLAIRRYKINNMGVFKQLFKQLNIPDDVVDKILHLMDKKLYDEALNLVLNYGDQNRDELIGIYKELIEIARYVGNNERVLSEIERVLQNMQVKERFAAITIEFQKLVEYVHSLQELGVDFVLDPAFARGIAYYNGIIFEVQVPNMEISIAGGGRYDNLSEIYGGPSISSTGFAIGVERTFLALQKNRPDILSLLKRRRVLVLLLERQRFVRVYQDIVKKLRKCCDVQFEVVERAKLSRWFDYASREGFDYVVVLGPRELERGVITVKDMAKWQQTELSLEQLFEFMCRG